MSGYTIWINGKQYDNRADRPDVAGLRRMAGIPEHHDFFAEGAPGEEDIRLPLDPDNQYESVPLSRWSRFHSTPRYINGS